MTQDADYVTNDLYPHSARPGGRLRPDRRSRSPPARPRRPRPAPSPTWPPRPIMGPTGTVRWGSAVPGHDRSSEPRAGRCRPVPGLLRPDRPDRLAQRRHLPGPDDDLRASPPVPSQPISQTLDAPDPIALRRVARQRRLRPDRGDHRSGERLQRVAQEQRRYRSRPRSSSDCPGNATTVPTTQAAGTLPSVETVAQQAQTKAKVAAAQKHAAKSPRRPRAAHPPRSCTGKPAQDQLASSTRRVSLGKEITKLPHQVYERDQAVDLIRPRPGLGRAGPSHSRDAGSANPGRPQRREFRSRRHSTDFPSGRATRIIQASSVELSVFRIPSPET